MNPILNTQLGNQRSQPAQKYGVVIRITAAGLPPDKYQMKPLIQPCQSLQQGVCALTFVQEAKITQEPIIRP
jgi:hypothetical protein